MGASKEQIRNGKQKGGFNRAKMIGNKFGKLTVISESHKRNGHIYWKCECECGGEHTADGSHLRRGNITQCKTCSVIPIGKDHAQWNGVGDISGNWWYNHIIRNTNDTKTRKPKEINITIEDGWKLFQEQDGVCAISGLKLEFPKKFSEKGTASLDRINNDMGYVHGNIQWLHKDVNMLKHTKTKDELIKLCNIISEYNKTTNN